MLAARLSYALSAICAATAFYFFSLSGSLPQRIENFLPKTWRLAEIGRHSLPVPTIQPRTSSDFDDEPLLRALADLQKSNQKESRAIAGELSKWVNHTNGEIKRLKSYVDDQEKRLVASHTSLASQINRITERPDVFKVLGILISALSACFIGLGAYISRLSYQLAQAQQNRKSEAVVHSEDKRPKGPPNS